ncbi:hypothetical protein ACF0H5_011927 [Mactra antiquata]
MASLFGDVTRTKKDVIANIVTLRFEYQKSIMDASMRKAILAESEKEVKEDMLTILNKLQRILKAIHDEARLTASNVVKMETEKINDEVLLLEEQHQSLEDIETTIKESTSNTNLKPLKIGQEKCASARERLEQIRDQKSNKCARFVLHPLLAEILEHIESFAMGDTMLIESPMKSEPENVIEEGTSDIPVSTIQRELSTNPLKTTFMRSNSSKLIKTPKNKSTNLSRQESTESKLSAASSIPTSVKEPLKISNLPKRSNTDARRPHNSRNKGELSVEERYASIAGLRATFTDRSASVPFISLSSKNKSAFVEKIEEPTSLGISFKETLLTVKHATEQCYITGIAALVNGSVVICDSVHDSLQLYDSEMKFVSEMTLPHPWGVTSVSDTAVAVSLHYDRKITLIKTDTEFERLNEKDIVLKCGASLIYDLKYYEFRIYALCVESDVHILDIKGRQYGVIKTGVRINTLKYLDVDIVKKNVIITGDSGVVCLNVQGLPLWNYKSPSKAKFTPTGITLYKDTVLICDWENGNLVEIYEDGLKTRTLYSGNLERPVALCRSETTSTLYVSQGDYDMNSEKARMVKILQVKDK